MINFTAIDFETAGYKPNSVCQVGLVRVEGGVIVDEYCGLIQPPNNYILYRFSREIHGIYPKDTANAPKFCESYPEWRHFVEGQTLVAHNMVFDLGCLRACLRDFCDLDMNFETYCTMRIWAGAFENKKLKTCCERLGVELLHHHNALADAKACAELFLLAIKHGRVPRGN